jgi:hypothetical protein
MTKKMISIIGAAAMALGCFLPAIHAPLLGSVSFMIGADGQSVAAIGAVALILGAMRPRGARKHSWMVWLANCGL